MEETRPKTTRTTAPADDPGTRFRELSQRVLLCAKQLRPAVDFLIELSATLLDQSAGDALELWLKDNGNCSRWESTARPRRFCRLASLCAETMEARVRAGVSRHDLPGVGDVRGEYRSMASFPLVAGDEVVGLLLLKSARPGCFDDDTLAVFRNISHVVAMALAYHRVHLGQRERVKELGCLYEIARTAAAPRLGLEEILSSLVRHLPPAWQYPELTAARIVLDSKSYQAGSFVEVRHRQSAAIVVDGVSRGEVEVAYLQDRPELDEGPFLMEERRLIDTVAREVAVIVERKAAEEDRSWLQEQLRHADRLATIGQLAAGVAHEINEPLGGILGFAQLASKHADLPEPARRDLSRIEAAALHAREVVRKLMLFARQTPPSRSRVALNRLVEEGLYFLESRCAKAGIEIRRALAEDLPQISADPAQIHQVLINLAVNALQAMSSGGTLTVETLPRDELVCLTVADTGCGMSPEVLEKAFVPFFTTKDVGEGTGLGLPVVYGIVASHGGRVEVSSQPGAGTRFEVLLPALPVGGGEE